MHRQQYVRVAIFLVKTHHIETARHAAIDLAKICLKENNDVVTLFNYMLLVKTPLMSYFVGVIE